MTLVILALI